LLARLQKVESMVLCVSWRRCCSQSPQVQRRRKFLFGQWEGGSSFLHSPHYSLSHFQQGRMKLWGTGAMPSLPAMPYAPERTRAALPTPSSQQVSHWLWRRPAVVRP
jgi:hypothetical protein